MLTFFTQNRLTLFPEGGVPGLKFFLSTAKRVYVGVEVGKWGWGWVGIPAQTGC